jgi:ABC-type uncharacterized transport system substrate-binding protein
MPDSDATLPAALQNMQTGGSHAEARRSAELCQSLDKADAPRRDMELGKQFAQTVTLQCQ